MRKTLAAYTPPVSPYPPYVNLTEEDSGFVRVTVRSPVKDDGSCGDTAAAVFPREAIKSLLEEVLAELPAIPR